MEDYIYAAARIHAREASLLGRADLDRLMACTSEEECFRVLWDRGWSQEASSAEELLAAEEERTWALLRELSPDPLPYRMLLLPIDCNNLKAAVKCGALRQIHRFQFGSRERWYIVIHNPDFLSVLYPVICGSRFLTGPCASAAPVCAVFCHTLHLRSCGFLYCGVNTPFELDFLRTKGGARSHRH